MNVEVSGGGHGALRLDEVEGVRLEPEDLHVVHCPACRSGEGKGGLIEPPDPDAVAGGGYAGLPVKSGADVSEWSFLDRAALLEGRALEVECTSAEEEIGPPERVYRIPREREVERLVVRPDEGLTSVQTEVGPEIGIGVGLGGVGGSLNFLK